MSSDPLIRIGRARSDISGANQALANFNRQLDAVIKDVNQQALRYVQTRAQQNLREKINENQRPDFQSGRLEAAIPNPAYSQADEHRIDFLIDERIRPAVPYYRVIEFGSSHFVGRRIPFFFLSNRRKGKNPTSAVNYPYSRGPSAARNTQNNRGVARPNKTDRIIGPRERRVKGLDGTGNLRFVTIRNPIPAYRYGTDAGRDLVRSGEYARLVKDGIARLGKGRT